MRVAHVVSSLSDPAAGTSHSVPQLCAALEKLGVQARLLTVEPFENGVTPHRVEAYPRSTLVGRLGVSRPLRDALRTDGDEPELIHVHGLWFPAILYGARGARRTARPLVLSPRGMLTPWAIGRHRYRKQLAWLIGHRSVLQHAACVHATSDLEVDDVRRLGYQGPVAVVANGVTPVSDGDRRHPHSSGQVLSLGRLHPKKGLDVLLHAWSVIEAEQPGWRLVIAGPDNGSHGRALRSLAARLGLERVSFVGLVTGQDRDRLYRESDLFVLPTRSENFGLVVAEALTAGVPVVVTQAAPWPELESRGAGWWVPDDVAGVLHGMRSATSQPLEVLRAMGVAGRSWARTAFAWPPLASHLLAVYEWVLGCGPRPDCVTTGRGPSHVRARLAKTDR